MVTGKLIFEIPNDPTAKQQLIEAVPDDWFCLNGLLEAVNPSPPIPNRVVIQNTGFEIDYLGVPTITRLTSKSEWHPEKLILGEGLPTYIRFKETGKVFGNNHAIFRWAKRLAASCAFNNFEGWVAFYKRVSEDGDNWPACCGFDLSRKPSRLTLEWQPEYGGTRECLAPIIQVCHGLRLHCLEPKA